MSDGTNKSLAPASAAVSSNSPETRTALGTPLADRENDPWFNRVRLVIFSDQQIQIGALLLACIVGTTGYFILQNWQHNGLIEIDQAEPLHAEFKININQAKLGEMVVLPGVGPKLAESIIDFRESNGPFESLERLADVPGIGPKKLEKMMPFLLTIDELASK